MPTTRRQFLGAVAAAPALLGVADGPGRRLGIGISSYAIRSRHEQGFTDPFRFLPFCRDRGAGGVQVPIGVLDDAEADRLRALAAEAGMILEGSTRPPDPDDPGDLDRFSEEIGSAARAGATVVRSVLMSGRRYETFHDAEAFRRFRDRSLRSLRLAGPVLDRSGARLAVENHKDFRADEFLTLLDEAGVDAVGTCVDLGNNLALLEDPSRTVADLAPRALTCHLKDMAVEESADGFLLSEVPLGRGLLDLPGLVATLRRVQPRRPLPARDDHPRPAPHPLPDRRLLVDPRRRPRLPTWHVLSGRSAVTATSPRCRGSPSCRLTSASRSRRRTCGRAWNTRAARSGSDSQAR